MARTTPLASLLAAATLIAASFGPASAQAVFPYDEGDIADVTWGLTAYAMDGALADVPEGVRPTLRLADGLATGEGGCAPFVGAYEIDGASPWIISFGAEIERTATDCEAPAREVEDAFLSLLPTTVSWSLEDGALELNDASEDPVLVFADGTSEVPKSTLDAILAQLETLTERVAELDQRVTGLEEGGASPADTDTAPGTKPRAPAARGRVRTTFPTRDPDPSRGLVRWRDRSDDEAGFRVYARRGYCELRPGVEPDQVTGTDDFRLARGPAVRIARLAPDAERYRPRHADIDDALPEAPASPYSNDQFYDLYVAAYNAAGESRRTRVGSYFLTPEFNCP